MKLDRAGIACVIALCVLGHMKAAAQDQPPELTGRWDVVVYKIPAEAQRSHIKRLAVVPGGLRHWEVEVFKYPVQPENVYIRKLNRLPSGR